MKKRTKIILALLVVVLIVILAFIGGQTYAKYMSKVTGKGTAAIASWSFKANESDKTMQNIVLKSTRNDTKIKDNKLAPGTSRNFSN